MKQEVRDFIREELKEVRQSVINSIEKIKLKDLLKNPYFMLAFFNIDYFIRYALEASIFKSMQTKFGNFVEDISIMVCGGGKAKSGMDGIDLDIIVGDNRLLISVKSGKTWGNSQSTKKQNDQFNKAKKTIQLNYCRNKIISIMGIISSNYATTSGLNYADFQVCGQNYWYLISNEKNFYLELGDEIMVGRTEFDKIFMVKLNEICAKLIKEFKHEYTINDLVQRSCGNFSPNDYLLKNLLPESEDHEFSK